MLGVSAMSLRVVYLVLTILCALMTSGLVVATMIDGHPLAGTLLIAMMGFLMTSVAAINAHYAPY